MEGSRLRRDLTADGGVAPVAATAAGAAAAALRMGGVEERFAFARAVSRLYEMQVSMPLRLPSCLHLQTRAAARHWGDMRPALLPASALGGWVQCNGSSPPGRQLSPLCGQQAPLQTHLPAVPSVPGESPTGLSLCPAGQRLRPTLQSP